MMIDARQQIGEALATVCDNVKMSQPDGDVSFPAIFYACRTNAQVSIGVTRLGWRVAVYCNTFEDLIDLVKAVDAVMSDELGYTRTNETPDDEARKGTDFYMKRLDYSAQVDEANMAVVRGSR